MATAWEKNILLTIRNFNVKACESIEVFDLFES